MNIRPRNREELSLDITPLIDVVFLMLIFFMVSTTFVHQSNLKITLPESSQNAQSEQSQQLELTITADGEYFLNGKPLVNRKRDTIEKALSKEWDQAKPVPLVVRADAKTPHEDVVRALDAAGRVGISQVAIATVPEKHE